MASRALNKVLEASPRPDTKLVRLHGPAAGFYLWPHGGTMRLRGAKPEAQKTQQGVGAAVAVRRRAARRCAHAVALTAERLCGGRLLRPAISRRARQAEFGNEGARQKGRYKLPPMSSNYIDACGREVARILRPSGYLALWSDTFNLCQGHHLRIADTIQVVDLIAWDKQYVTEPVDDRTNITHGPPATNRRTARTRRNALPKAAGSRPRRRSSGRNLFSLRNVYGWTSRPARVGVGDERRRRPGLPSASRGTM